MNIIGGVRITILVFWIILRILRNDFKRCLRNISNAFPQKKWELHKRVYVPLERSQTQTGQKDTTITHYMRSTINDKSSSTFGTKGALMSKLISVRDTYTTRKDLGNVVRKENRQSSDTHSLWEKRPEINARKNKNEIVYFKNRILLIYALFWGWERGEVLVPIFAFNVY